MTDGSRYQQKDWPAWMDSRWLMTINGAQWLDHGGKEIAIPSLGWICNNPDGTITVRGALEMEEWAKMVPDIPLVATPAADGMEDESHLVAMFPQHVPEGKTAEDYKRKLKPDNSNIGEVVDQFVFDRLVQPADDSVSLAVVTEILVTLDLGDIEDAKEMLRAVLSERVVWCNCAPNQCIGESGLGCRKSSPLL